MNRRSLLLSAGATALAACATSPAATSELAWSGELDARIAQAMTRVAIAPGLAVAVYTPEGAYARGFGVADLDSQAPVDAATAFYIASATKPLTALALAALHARGDFDMDAPIGDYAPDANFPAAIRPDQVSFRHLLSHTSGVSNRGIAYRVAYSGEHDPETLWRLLAASTSNTESPLGQFQYTNEGYNIATVLTDRKLGMRWQDLLDREVFTPAGMNRATAYMSRAKARGLVARPYLAALPEGPRPVYLEKVDATMQSAGGVVMSAQDAARWLELMVENGRVGGRQVVPAAAVAMVREQQVAMSPQFDVYERTGYGLGWYLGSHRGEALLHQFGGFAGARAHVSFAPARRVGVAAFVNDSTAAASIVDAVANYVYDRTAARADAETRFDEAIATVVANIDRENTRIATDRANRAQRPWTLTRPRADYAGAYVSETLGTITVAVSDEDIEVLAGVMHAVATPFTQPDSIRVELSPGQGWAIAFELGSTGPAALTIQGERFVRT